MTGTGGSGSGEPEIGSVRWNDRGDFEYYDGTVWKPYADIDWDESVLYRDPLPVTWREPEETDRDATEGPEPR
ncbi:hypothetical protein ACIQ6Y_18775 [Streptomyces sp. NPDC096205]|uniref:hypothetical protein n=1 Tax=Streptomyces sp. NPDC096205 TaxID=3366081 RepID=UPI0038201422